MQAVAKAPSQDTQQRIQELYGIARQIGTIAEQTVYTDPVITPAAVQPTPEQPFNAQTPPPPVAPVVNPVIPPAAPPPHIKKSNAILWFWIALAALIGILSVYGRLSQQNKGSDTPVVVVKPPIEKPVEPEVITQLPADNTGTDTDTDTGTSLVGSNVPGPDFSAEFPNGVYNTKDCSTKLIFSINQQPVKGSGATTPDQLVALASKADSALHKTSDGVLYTLLEPDSLLTLRHKTSCETVLDYVGLGLTFEKAENGFMRISVVYDDTPIARAGVAAGDLITAINNLSTANMTTTQASDEMKGNVGESATLLIQRGSGKPRSVTVKRTSLSIPQSWEPEGWVAIYRSADGTYNFRRDFEEAWSNFPIGVPYVTTWPLVDKVVGIKVARPNAEHDSLDREVDYSFYFEQLPPSK